MTVAFSPYAFLSQNIAHGIYRLINGLYTSWLTFLIAHVVCQEYLSSFYWATFQLRSPVAAPLGVQETAKHGSFIRNFVGK